MVRKSKKLFESPKKVWDFFVKEETRSSSLLIIAAVVALVWANSAYSTSYFDLWHTQITFGKVTLDLQHWVNEALMSLFFLVVTLEIKRELIDGELRGWRKASFPVFAAIGGMLVPALIFTLINPTPPESLGWAIPMATDIAIAMGVIGLLGTRIPRSLRVFLLTLAIVDDIGSIAVINIFYSQPSNMLAILIAVGFGIALAAVRNNKYWLPMFGVFGFGLLYCLLLAGVPGTMAGVVVAFLMPLKTSRKNTKRLQTSETVEDKLLPFTSYFIVPLFVLANAGINFNSSLLQTTPEIKVFFGVALGLLVGKPLGIYLSTRLATALRLTHKPSNISWGHITGVGFIAGIGFTVSLFISSLAYENEPGLQNAATLGIFAASVLAGIIGLNLLTRTKKTSK